jgi:hypothetical protein
VWGLFKTGLYIYLYKIILALLVLVTIIFSYFYFKIADPKTSALLGGLATGLLVAIIQLLMMWSDYAEAEKFKKLKIKKILPHRDEESLYKNIIMQSNEEICVLGNTASRFLADFADKNRPDKRALLDAFLRDVKVKFLLPNPKHLITKADQIKAQMAELRILELLSENEDNFECKYYDHAPSHNLIIADNECLVGPIFPNISSKDSPAIYTDKSSVYVKPYIKYFKAEWASAEPCKIKS